MIVQKRQRKHANRSVPKVNGQQADLKSKDFNNLPDRMKAACLILTLST